MSWESTAIYYRLLNQLARDRLGGLHSASLLMWSFDFAVIEQLQARADWEGATAAMIDAARRVERGGAECLIICTNTMHKMADEVQSAIDIPLLHIADATACAIKRSSVEKPLLLATRYTMEQEFYRGRLERHGIGVCVPKDDDRTTVHDIIYEELCRGIIDADSKRSYLSIIARERASGADGVIFGCTEVCLLIGPDDMSVPVFDTTTLHAQAAIDYALNP